MPVIASRLGSAPSSAVALVGAGDPAASRLVYSMVIGLVVIGVLLVVLGIWIIRQTRVDLDVLAPLERMGDSEWKKRDRSTQRRMLDEVRPDGAQPLAPANLPPSLDDEFELAEHPVASLSDLGPGVVAEERDPTPMGSDAEPAIGPDLADQPVTSLSDLGPGVASEVGVESDVESDVESLEEVDDESEVESPAEVRDESVAEVVDESDVESPAEVDDESDVEPPAEVDDESDVEPAPDARN